MTVASQFYQKFVTRYMLFLSLCMKCRRLCYRQVRQTLAAKKIPANANDPRWRRRDALHFHGKTKGRTGQKILLPPNFTASLLTPSQPVSKSSGSGWPKKRQTFVESATRTLDFIIIRVFGSLTFILSQSTDCTAKMLGF